MLMTLGIITETQLLTIPLIPGVALRLPLPFPNQKVWPVFQSGHKCLEFLSGQNQETDLALDLRKGFSDGVHQSLFSLLS
jgi:hypothetical protein